MWEEEALCYLLSEFQIPGFVVVVNWSVEEEVVADLVPTKSGEYVCVNHVFSWRWSGWGVWLLIRLLLKPQLLSELSEFGS